MLVDIMWGDGWLCDGLSLVFLINIFLRILHKVHNCSWSALKTLTTHNHYSYFPPSSHPLNFYPSYTYLSIKRLPSVSVLDFKIKIVPNPNPTPPFLNLTSKMISSHSSTFPYHLSLFKINDITLKLQSRSIILVQRLPTSPKHNRIAPYSFPHCSSVHPLIFASCLLEYIRQMANFLVSTTNIDQQARLEEQFYHQGQYFIVPKNGNPTLEAIFRTISFEYYQNSPSVLAQKIIAFAESMINSACSLTSLRDILEAVKNQEDRLGLMHQYFWEINRELGDKEMSKEELGISEECSLAQQNDRLFDLASRGELRLTRNLETSDFHQVFQASMKHYCPQSISQKTQVPQTNSINPQQSKEKLDNSNHFAFHTAEHYYGNQWWKAQKISDSSKEISKFDLKAGNPFSQKSIGRLVLDEFRYDLNREIQLGKEINKHQEVEGFKYKKMMKDKLLSAKLKKKKKK